MTSGALRLPSFLLFKIELRPNWVINFPATANSCVADTSKRVKCSSWWMQCTPSLWHCIIFIVTSAKTTGSPEFARQWPSMTAATSTKSTYLTSLSPVRTKCLILNEHRTGHAFYAAIFTISTTYMRCLGFFQL